jgi:nicotinamide-nucleotide amidase
MLTCEIITIGSELLNGSTLNTNAQYLARKLSEIDFEVYAQMSPRDVRDEIINALDLSWKRSHLIIMTGGLGPTPDDITRDAIAHYFNCGLKFNSAQYQHIVKFFHQQGIKTPYLTRQEACFPEIAKPLLNKFGIALGFYIEQDGRIVIVLPGVPRELVGMYESSVEKLIKRKFPDRPKNYMFEARAIGISEATVMRHLGRRFFKGRDFVFGIYPFIGQVFIRVKTKHKKLLDILKRDIERNLKGHLYSFSGQTISEVIGLELVRRNASLAVAESCTGGWLAKELTDTPGASKYFKGGVVAYSNQVKKTNLNVPVKLLARYGAVSSAAAKAMASGVAHSMNSAYGIAVTGIAGPAGGSQKKPVGLVYIGVFSKRRGAKAYRFRFVGERDRVRAKAVQKSLELIWQTLKTD